jgi:hypothetical protein
MPNVKDAPMLLVGIVSNIEAKTTYLSAEDRAKGKPAKPDGVRVLVAAGDGFALVKVAQDDLGSVSLVVGERVGWLVRPSHWSGDDRGSGMSVRFIRTADHADLDFLGSAIRAGAMENAGV